MSALFRADILYITARTHISDCIPNVNLNMTVSWMSGHYEIITDMRIDTLSDCEFTEIQHIGRSNTFKANLSRMNIPGQSYYTIKES